jgi:ketosteroid isomerase-like protein
MSAPLPQPLTEYFRATNEHDVAATLASFAADAIVEDEGRQYLGLAAIRKWIEETIRKYDFTVEVKGTHVADGKTVVAGLVAGAFPGSPVNMTYEFTLAHLRIVRVVIR